MEYQLTLPESNRSRITPFQFVADLDLWLDERFSVKILSAIVLYPDISDAHDYNNTNIQLHYNTQDEELILRKSHLLISWFQNIQISN